MEAAKNAYHRVLERNPHHAKVLQQLGWLYHQESNHYSSQEKAIEFLEQSVGSGEFRGSCCRHPQANVIKTIQMHKAGIC